ncbi:nuclease-related domain-containing protein [Aerococcus sp. UMB1112A]|uniref:nuclease-related domain-containing protein n=1 Tax=Aerococcus sp. UMB1112A TaxID=3050609 RepID=UPI00254D1494|nr:nuclease-related domain-containing protein [Aerococcus sp. UMB1112A]MDK8503326.1 nuclease-related domain-containing protein [Aerococcus sp. UMB1112A]
MQKNHELLSLEILEGRQCLDDDQTERLQALRHGYWGEWEFHRILKKYLTGDFVLLTDCYFGATNATQVDAVLVCPSGCYLFDVKNYRSPVRYEAGTFYHNDKLWRHNIFIQLERMVDRFNQELAGFGRPSGKQGYLVFINENHQVTVDDSFDHGVLCRNDILTFLKDVSREPGRYRTDQLLRAVQDKLLPNPYEQCQLTTDHWARMQGGIYCWRCRGALGDIYHRKKITCQACGFVEDSEILVYRHLCELAVLLYDQPLSFSMAEYFLGNNCAERRLNRVLAKYFIRIKRNTYQNPFKNDPNLYDKIVRPIDLEQDYYRIHNKYLT